MESAFPGINKSVLERRGRNGALTGVERKSAFTLASLCSTSDNASRKNIDKNVTFLC